ncbi:transcriptional activator srcap [Paramyrothecium foliicola]|nr:transcriptional activator srcap [Paramyrothecium foliicola]
MAGRDQRRAASARWASLPHPEETFDDLDRSLESEAEEILRHTLANRTGFIDRSGRLVIFKPGGIAYSGPSHSTSNEDEDGTRHASSPLLFGERDWTRAGSRYQHSLPPPRSGSGRSKLPDHWRDDGGQSVLPRMRRRTRRRSEAQERAGLGGHDDRERHHKHEPFQPALPVPGTTLGSRYASSGTQTLREPGEQMQPSAGVIGSDGKPQSQDGREPQPGRDPVDSGAVPSMPPLADPVASPGVRPGAVPHPIIAAPQTVPAVHADTIPVPIDSVTDPLAGNLTGTPTSATKDPKTAHAPVVPPEAPSITEGPASPPLTGNYVPPLPQEEAPGVTPAAPGTVPPTVVAPRTGPVSSPPSKGPLPLEELYMLTADGRDNSVRGPGMGLSIGKVPMDHVAYAKAESATQQLMLRAGSLLFDTALGETDQVSSYELYMEDAMRNDINSLWMLGKETGDPETTDITPCLQSISVDLQACPDKSFEITNLKVQVSKDETALPLVFSASADVLNQQFEVPSTAPQSAERAALMSRSGVERHPGFVLLGLEQSPIDPARPANGGFETLGDLVVLADLNPRSWLKKLLLGTRITMGSSEGLPARNAIWYQPGAGSRCSVRLEASVNLHGAIIEKLDKYISGWSEDMPPFSAVAKRSVRPSSGPWGNAHTQGSLVLAAEPKVMGIERALGAYVEFSDDEICLMLVCYSKELQWSALKDWILKSCSEVEGAIGGLEETLGRVGDGAGKRATPDPKSSSALDHIKWRRVAVTLGSGPDEKTTLTGLTIDLEANVPLLVPQGKDAVFTMTFDWDKAGGKFSGEVSFQGAGNTALLDSESLPLRYMENYEKWSHMTYLTPSERYMSLRHINNEIMQHLPFGVPTEISLASLFVSNEALRVEAELQAITCAPSISSTAVSSSGIPPLQILHTALRLTANFRYGGVPKNFDVALSGCLSLVPFREGSEPPMVEAMVKYGSINNQVYFNIRAANIPMTLLHSLFWAGEEATRAMSILEHIVLQEASLTYQSSTKTSPNIEVKAILKISSLTLETTFTRSNAEDWVFAVNLEPKLYIGKASQEFTLEDPIRRLLGADVADMLPDFVKTTQVKTSGSEKDKFSVRCKRLKEPKCIVFGAELVFGMIHVQFAQYAPLDGKQDPTAKDKSKQVPKPKRLIRVSLGPLPSLPKLPLVGNLDVPFDSLEFLWLSTAITDAEIKALNENLDIFSGHQIALSQDAKEITEGFHFRLVGAKGVMLDHCFDHKQEKKPTEPAKAGSSTPPVQKQTGKKQDAVAKPPAGGNAAATTAPLDKKKGPVKLSGIALSYEGGTLCISLDASVLIGPIGAGVQGLNLVLDLKSVKGLHDLLHVPIDVSIEGFNMSFDRDPVMLAGALYHKPGTQSYFGGVAISLSSFSIAALGAYEQVPAKDNVPAYDSFFVYAMAEGLLFTVGWAEVRGIIAGFGYNSRLRLPTVDQLTEFPLIKGFKTPGGFSMETAIKDLTGQDAFVVPSMGSLWLALGLVIRACEVIDMRAVATVALGPNQTEVGLIARATASLPRGSTPDKALILIDLSVIGKLDLLHGELSVDGQINPTSFILNKDCRPSGGFAIRSWFGKNSPHAGDWVVSFGGYHPMFKVPAHYPVPKRLGISWTLSSHLRVTGNAYAAITPGAIMAGGMLQAVFSAGSLGAHFDAHADFLVNLKPLYYKAEMAISAGVYYEIRVWFVRKKISVNVGASLILEGPPIRGKVYFDLCVVKFSVSFGSGIGDSIRPISLGELMDLVLQNAALNREKNVIQNAHTFTVVSGLVSDTTSESSKAAAHTRKPGGEKDAWIVRSDNLLFQVRSPIPISCARVVGESGEYFGNEICSRPMHMKRNQKEKFTTTMDVKVCLKNKEDALPFRKVAKIYDQLPANYWGEHSQNPADYVRGNSAPTEMHLVGMTLLPPPAVRPSQSMPVFKSLEENYPARAWRPDELTAESVRFVDCRNARDSVKWSRIRGAMTVGPEEASAGATTNTKQRRPKPTRTAILGAFIISTRSGKDAGSRQVMEAYPPSSMNSEVAGLRKNVEGNKAYEGPGNRQNEVLGEINCTILHDQPWEYQTLQEMGEWAMIKETWSCYVENNNRYDGFKRMDGPAIKFWPTLPGHGGKLGFKNKCRNSRIVMMHTQSLLEQVQDEFQPYEIFLYRGWFSALPHHDDGQRFVYIAETDIREPPAGDFFIHVKDIYARMGTSHNEDVLGGDYEKRIARLTSERNGSPTHPPFFDFHLWNASGEVDLSHSQRLFDKLNRSTTVNLRNKTEACLHYFCKFAALLRNSQRNAYGVREHYGRYWDQPVPERVWDIVCGGFFIVFDHLIREKAIKTVDPEQMDPDNSLELARKYLLETYVAPIMTGTQFKLTLDLDNVVFEGELQKTMGNEWFTKHERLPNPINLYRIVLTDAAMSALCTDLALPLRMDPYVLLPGSNGAEGVNIRIGDARDQPFGTTTTLVSHNSIIWGKAKRWRTQNQCMGDQSANSVAKDIIRNSPTKGFEVVATPFGVLIRWVGNKWRAAASELFTNIQKSRVGYESSLKRLVKFFQQRLEVTTMAGYDQGQLADGEPPWVRNRRFPWLAPMLSYRYQFQGENFAHEVLFNTLGRDRAMMFEAILDRKIEYFYYGGPEEAVNDVVKETEGEMEIDHIPNDRVEAGDNQGQGDLSIE